MSKVYGVIYMIKNKVNRKVYIGQTRQKRGFKSRYDSQGEGIERVYNFYSRQKKNNEFVNKYLYNSIEKYGFDAFEVCEEFDRANTIEELNALEEKYIKQFNSTDSKFGYNIKNGGDNRRFTEKERFIHSLNTGKPLKCRKTKEIFLSINEVSRRFSVEPNNLGLKIRKYNEVILNKDNIEYKIEPLKRNDRAIVDMNNFKVYYDGITASKETGVRREKISRICADNRRKGNNKDWCYLTDIVNNVSDKKKIC